ncbi:hypothetical protein ACWXWU_20730 [Shewanella sp. A14]
MKASLKSQLSHFDKTDFTIGSKWKDAISVFFYWALPAFLTVLLVHKLAESRTVEYYQAAISQGIGPVLWNFIAVFGCAMFGVSFIFNKVKLFSNIAQQLLVNVYAIGSLTFGLLFGQLCVLTPALREQVEVWKLFFIFPLTSLLLLFILLQNFLMWYLSNLIRWDGSFISKLSLVSFLGRFFVGILFSSTFLVLLWIEK